MKIILATSLYFVRQDQFLSAIKMRSIGIGKYFGYGGKFEPVDNNDPNECTSREVGKESGGTIIVDKKLLQPAARIDFFNGEENKPYAEESTVIRVIFQTSVQEIPTLPPSTDEMRDPAWLSMINPPWDEIRNSDKCFLPFIFTKVPVRGFIWTKNEGEIVIDSLVKPIKEINDFMSKKGLII